jgi:ornithine cyclodeaminase/alanine dehydrogenase-like protein (mu-crystallin family)
VNGFRVVAADELRAHVRFEDLVEPVSKAFQDSSARLAQNGLIVMFPGDSPASGDVYVKTGTLKGRGVYTVKVSPWFAVNVERGQPQGGFIGVFDSRTGHTLALLDEEHYLSDMRTAAAGSLAARSLAPASVTTAAVLGAGVQAYWQPQALFRERPFEVLLIWARNPDKAVQLKERLAGVLPQVEIQVVADIEETVRRCEVLMTTTSAREPIVRGEWLRPGQHITAVGADDATKCELDVAALKRARVFVDSLDSTAANGDVARAIQTGRYALDEVSGELGEVLAGRKPGRVSEPDITIVKLVGIGAQDLIAAEVSLQRLGLFSPTSAAAIGAKRHAT